MPTRKKRTRIETTPPRQRLVKSYLQRGQAWRPDTGGLLRRAYIRAEHPQQSPSLKSAIRLASLAHFDSKLLFTRGLREILAKK
jgi:hypothetical protein